MGNKHFYVGIKILVIIDFSLNSDPYKVKYQVGAHFKATFLLIKDAGCAKKMSTFEIFNYIVDS